MAKTKHTVHKGKLFKMSTFGKYCNDFEQISGDSEGQGSLACCGLWIRKESALATERLSN